MADRFIVTHPKMGNQTKGHTAAEVAKMIASKPGTYWIEGTESDAIIRARISDGLYEMEHVRHDSSFYDKLEDIEAQYSWESIQRKVRKNPEKYAAQPEETRFDDLKDEIEWGIDEYHDMVVERDNFSNARATKIATELRKLGLQTSSVNEEYNDYDDEWENITDDASIAAEEGFRTQLAMAEWDKSKLNRIMETGMRRLKYKDRLKEEHKAMRNKQSSTFKKRRGY